MKRALIIEDDRDIASAIEQELEYINFASDLVGDGLSGVDKARGGGYVIIVLDLMLPKLEGVEVCRQIRSFDSKTPILILTARNHESDKVLLLELGADDFISKPFSIPEFRARVKALIRRSERTAEADGVPDVLAIGPFRIDLLKRKVLYNGEVLSLTSNEFDLLQVLAEQPGRAFSRSQLSNLVHGYDSSAYDHSISTAINRLRAKIEPDPANPTYILTIRGVGYAFAEIE